MNHLVRDRIPEGTTLDYKKTVDLNSPKGRADLAKDISAFANESGGEIVVGITTVPSTRGEPEVPDGSLPGLPPLPNFVQRIQDIAADSIRPRIPSWDQRVLDASSGEVIYVLRVPRSVRGPHMASERFYHRSGHRSQPMDESAVRARYLESRDAFAEIEDFFDSNDMRTAEAAYAKTMNLQVAMVPEVLIPGVIDLPSRLPAVHASSRNPQPPILTWFGAHDRSDGLTYWRYYDTGALIVWEKAPPIDIQSRWVPAGGAPIVARALPVGAVLSRAAATLWSGRAFFSGIVGLDLVLRVQWRHADDTELVPDFQALEAHAGDRLRSAVLFERRILQATANLSVEELASGPPIRALKDLSREVGAFFGYSDADRWIHLSTQQGADVALLTTPGSRKPQVLWPPPRY